ncbi:MAG TPA: hypothetical protein VKJ65_00720 [Phycisphaerae bacterium]|nr:hypothetical protein [Phycisphaerae bacterium]
MKLNLVFCIALVLSGLVVGCSTTTNQPAATISPEQAQTGDPAWQTTLRDALAKGDVVVPVMAGWKMFYTVPAPVAKILESQPPAELLPFLAKLRTEPLPWKAGIVDEWSTIVRDGLHGTSQIITNTLSNAKGQAVLTTEISAYVYSDEMLQRWVPATNGLQMWLSILKTDDWHDPGFEVTFENMGENDVCLNLGNMLANGKFQLPTRIHLQLGDASGNVRELKFADRRHAGVAGRVDDYAVPLRSGSSYTLELRLDQFWSPGTEEFDLKLKPGRYSVSAWYQGGGSQTDIHNTLLMNFWPGRLE